MSQPVEINTEYGQIIGQMVEKDFKVNFQGKLIKNDENILDIEFSIPYSFRNKYGEQVVLDEIKDSVVQYLKKQM